MNESLEAIKYAFDVHAVTAESLIAAWRNHLTDERADQLAMYEAKGLRLGVFVTVPENKYRPVVNIMLVDYAGGMQPLDTIQHEPGANGFTVN